MKAVGLALFLCSLSGCAWSRCLFDKNPYGDCAACHLPEGTEGSEIVARINARAERNKAWRANSARITYKGPEGTHSLTAHIAVQAPLNFSLVGSSVMGQEVELGSNCERFWFWARRSPRKCILTARHEDLEVAQQQFPIPFQPEWLMETLGVIPMDPNGVTVEPADPDPQTKKSRVWLISNRTSPSGEPVKKVTLVDACHGLPLKHELIGADNKRIATAALYNWKAGSDGEPVPGSINLSWPAAKLELTLELGPVELNPSIPERMWELPTYANTPVYDLGRMGHAKRGKPRTMEGNHVPRAEVAEPEFTDAATTDEGANNPTGDAVLQGDLEPEGKTLPVSNEVPEEQPAGDPAAAQEAVPEEEPAEPLPTRQAALPEVN